VVQSTRTFHFSVALSVCLLYYSIFLLIPETPLLNDPDTFWHIRTGQWILDHSQFPTIDVFSYTAAGKPWISTEWLSEIFFAVAFKVGGWHAVVVLAAITCGAIIGLLCFYLLQNLRFSVAIAWTAFSAATISSHFLARPHIFSYVLLVIWMAKLLDAYDHNEFNTSSVLTFAPLMALWSNLHGSFTFGLAMLYIFAGVCLCQNFIRRNYIKPRAILLVVSAVTIIALITPYGISSAAMTLELLNLKYTIPQIIELHSPDFQKSHLQLFLFVALLSAMAGLGIRLRGARLIAFSVIVFIGLQYERGLVMFFLLAPVILARPISASARYLTPQHSEPLASETGLASDYVLRFLQKWFIVITAACAAVAVLVTLSTWWLRDVAPPKSVAPKAAIDFVQRNNITGYVFNEYGFGGFLIFSGIPTFVDGRALPFGDAFLHKYFDAVNLVDIDGAFQLLNDYKISWIIWRPAEPFAKAIARSGLWDKVYADEYSVVFIRHRS
jgi:hypothetical protein